MSKPITLEKHLTNQQLRRKYLSCRHPQEKLRWQALMLIAEGAVAGQVAEKLGRSSAWMTKTARRYNEGGAAAVRNKSKNGGSKILTAEQLKELEALIESGKTASAGLWSARQIKSWVKDQTGKDIHKTTAWRMFAKLEFSRQVPRPAHQAKAGETEQAEFKKS
jgi:transposase